MPCKKKEVQFLWKKLAIFANFVEQYGCSEEENGDSGNKVKENQLWKNTCKVK